MSRPSLQAFNEGENLIHTFNQQRPFYYGENWRSQIVPSPADQIHVNCIHMAQY
ncbi:MAG: hypothetical protein RMY29_029890 [Nostoc sp. CreGUA01]|nr:hypothetical protein [Nostoc sp. CreGUA01]